MDVLDACNRTTPDWISFPPPPNRLDLSVSTSNHRVRPTKESCQRTPRQGNRRAVEANSLFIYILHITPYPSIFCEEIRANVLILIDRSGRGRGYTFKTRNRARQSLRSKMSSNDQAANAEKPKAESPKPKAGFRVEGNSQSSACPR